MRCLKAFRLWGLGLDIHQDQVGTQSLNQPQRLLGRGRGSRRVITQLDHLAGQVTDHDLVVVHDQDFGFVHWEIARVLRVSRVIR